MSTDSSAPKHDASSTERPAPAAPGDTARLRWAVLGPGSIARRFAGQLPHSEFGVLVGAGSRDPERAREFAREFGFAEDPGAVIGTYEEVLASDAVDAVYVSTVHTEHARLSIAALEAGKHVLCEKPLAANHGTAMAVADVARRTGRVLLEAFMYRFHPQTLQVLDLVREGAIGELAHVDASFSFDTGAREGRLFDPQIAGGGILDVGCYPLSFARLVAGAAAGRTAVEPASLSAAGTVGPTGVDEWASAELTFPGGATASLRTGVRLADPQSATITGSRGVIRLEDPWTLGEDTVIHLDVVGEEPREIRVEHAHPYALEADALASAVSAGRSEVPELDLEVSLGQARALDDWREQIGLRYPFEREDSAIPTVSGAPLRVREDGEHPAMPYGEIPGVGKRISRLVMGCDNQPNLAHASALFDAFVEAGGTTFDSAYIYGGGHHELQLGQWITNRGIREDVVVITKGAHTPHCDPASLSRQLLESLERQQTDYADLYMMHRDNLDIPVGEFVDVLNEHLEAGRIRAFGGSNWTPARVDEANAYAAAHGKQGFSLLSNHFGLAEALDVPWAGCVHATDPDSKAWLEERKIPLFPWSSQARGFFTGRAAPEDRSDAELVRCYYSDGNFERLERARTLAREFGVPPTAIALAYVLAQPFPTFPLFGPRSIAEMRSSMEGLSVQLTPEQVAWLDLREDVA
ncbi:aldo/keto reductase [Brachybacterium halotolerans subsp. kimchii]|uniref:aldo/keto reductase n=1 Tax=Brachybacterium halotolerans TaxID=2795215 RepID=UPI001E2F45C7|nr:aldo/keto reductase [Brachybacterium halotolerans]UEJ82867.1 aldo/keto reductase [Brachybacterium halotolerans subsp. kimchii]